MRRKKRLLTLLKHSQKQKHLPSKKRQHQELAQFPYSGDSALCAPVAKLCQNADLLIHWCYRLSGETDYPTVTAFSPSAGEIAEMAQRMNVKHLLLTHIRKHMDIAGHLNEMKAEAAHHFAGQIGIAEDLMQIDI